MRRLRALGTTAFALAIAATLAACVTLTTEPRGLVLQADRSVQVRAMRCPVAAAEVATPPGIDTPALDPQALRITSWNIHKEADAGWERDLARFAGQSDVLLLQEAVLLGTLRQVVEGAGLHWSMATSFLLNDDDIGVLTAARVAPYATCIERGVEPLLGLPKSALITWFRLARDERTLAIVNLHAVNFTLTLGAYRDQQEAIAQALSRHRGPVVLAGDFNTWNDARLGATRELAARLGLVEVTFADDLRSRFLDHPVDHVFVRDLAVQGAEAFVVSSSDHHPVAVTLRLLPPSPRRPPQ